MKTKATLRKTTAGALCLCLLILSTTFTSVATTTPGRLVDDVSPDEGARQFDEAVREVESILALDLSTEAGVKRAADIFKRNEKKLAHFEQKAFQAALRVSAFHKGLKAEAAKRKGGSTELAKELETNPSLIGNIPGAEEAAEALKNATRPSAEKFQKVAAALKNAADAAKAKNTKTSSHHATPTLATELTLPTTVSDSASPANFCGSYQYICDLLSRVGLHVLRAQIAVIRAGTRKANCAVSSYLAYGSCITTRWWDTAYCLSRLSTSISNCLLFA